MSDLYNVVRSLTAFWLGLEIESTTGVTIHISRPVHCSSRLENICAKPSRIVEDFGLQPSSASARSFESGIRIEVMRNVRRDEPRQPGRRSERLGRSVPRPYDFAQTRRLILDDVERAAGGR